MKKYLSIISISILVVMLLLLALYPTITPTLGAISPLFSLALSTYTIYTKHAGTENARVKIFKEVE